MTRHWSRVLCSGIRFGDHLCKLNVARLAHNRPYSMQSPRMAYDMQVCRSFTVHTVTGAIISLLVTTFIVESGNQCMRYSGHLWCHLIKNTLVRYLEVYACYIACCIYV